VTALHRFALQVVLLVGAIAAGWLWHLSEVSTARKAGYSAAVAAGEKQRAIDADIALGRERNLRAKLAAADAAATTKETEHAETLAAAQRRVRAGTDVLRCPTANPIQHTAALADGPTTGGSSPDGPGTAVMPEVAGDILRLAADTGRVVRNYQRVVERLDACIALNNGPAPADEGSNPAH
jgi:hypothetical protein